MIGEFFQAIFYPIYPLCDLLLLKDELGSYPEAICNAKYSTNVPFSQVYRQYRKRMMGRVKLELWKAEGRIGMLPRFFSERLKKFKSNVNEDEGIKYLWTTGMEPGV